MRDRYELSIYARRGGIGERGTTMNISIPDQDPVVGSVCTNPDCGVAMILCPKPPDVELLTIPCWFCGSPVRELRQDECWREYGGEDWTPQSQT